jgi:DNA-binding NarL/FixJ family response regulator
MRVIIVGMPRDRDILRQALRTESFEVVGEALTIGAARASGLEAEAFIVAAATATPRDLGLLPEPLTRREVEVLELLADGLPNKAIAMRLGISDQTVKFHVASISGKLGAANRTEAVRIAIRRGIVTI